MPFTRVMANTANTRVTSITSAKAAYSLVDTAIPGGLLFDAPAVFVVTIIRSRIE
jgi:hypothetical protein